jgi:ankyrin repeat protein
MQKLVVSADPNVRTTQGATPVMNAAQSNKVEPLNLLLKSGALINAKDNRGFTALHRAAAMGIRQF